MQKEYMMQAYYSLNSNLLFRPSYKMLKNVFYFMLLSIYLYSPQLHACNLSLQGLDNINISFNHAYSKKSVPGQIAVEQFSVHSTDSNCSFFITFSNFNNNKLINNYGQKLSYEIYDSVQHKSQLGDISSIQTNNLLSGHLNKHQPSANFNYYLHVPYKHNAAAGIYSNTVDISVYEGTANNYILRDTQRVRFNVTIPTDISVSIQSTLNIGTRSNLDFGTLQIGESRSFSVIVTANTPYDISIESENRGNLLHNKNKPSASIPYKLQHNAGNINLNRTTVLSQSKRKFKQDINSYEFKATIKEFDFVLSGKYEDNLVFTVSAK